jgi:transposase
MPPAISKQQKSRERLQVLLEAGIVEAEKLRQKTKISLSTIYDVLAKLNRGKALKETQGQKDL